MVWVVVVLVGVAAREAVGKAWAGRVAAAREEEEGVVVVRVAAAVARAAWAAEARAVGAKAAVAMAVVAQVVVAMVAAARVVPMADSTEVEARVAVALAGVAVMAAVATALAVVVTVEVVVWAPATVVEEVVAVAMAAGAATAAVAAATAAMRVEEEDVAALEEAAVTGSAGDWVMAGADRHQSHSHQSCSHPSRPQRSRRPRERAWERWRRGLCCCSRPKGPTNRTLAFSSVIWSGDACRIFASKAVISLRVTPTPPHPGAPGAAAHCWVARVTCRPPSTAVACRPSPQPAYFGFLLSCVHKPQLSTSRGVRWRTHRG